MSEHSPGSNGSNHTILKLIASFVTLSSYLVLHQIDVTSAHLTAAFNIPIHNISIYFDKLFSFRCLLVGLGTAADFLISQITNAATGNNGGVGGSGNGKVDSGRNVRKYYSIGCFIILSAIRILFLFLLYASKNLAYHIYIVLSLEALFFGPFLNSLITLAPEHSLAIVSAANISRFFILLVQFILDMLFSNNPLLTIKVQTWIGNIFTVCAIFLWITYHFGDLSGNGNEKKSEGAQNQGSNGGNGQQNEKGFGETLMETTSPFFMFFAGSMFKDFLFPGTLPYALLERRKCHLINMLVPIANLIGPVCLFALEVAELFETWEWYFNVFWILAIPMPIIFVYSFLAIHTRIPSARRIANNRNLVLVNTLVLVFCNAYLNPLSFFGVAKIVKPPNVITNGTSGKGGQVDPNSQDGDVKVMTLHLFLALFMRMVFSKLSVGYNTTRVSLGYTLPRFRPRHRMSKRNTFWYIFKQVFRRAAVDTLSDFKMNIKKYL